MIPRMLLAGLAGIMISQIYAAIMQLKFQNTTNTVGKGFAILGIYLYSIIYCKDFLRAGPGWVLTYFRRDDK